MLDTIFTASPISLFARKTRLFGFRMTVAARQGCELLSKIRHVYLALDATCSGERVFLHKRCVF